MRRSYQKMGHSLCTYSHTLQISSIYIFALSYFHAGPSFRHSLAALDDFSSFPCHFNSPPSTTYRIRRMSSMILPWFPMCFGTRLASSTERRLACKCTTQCMSGRRRIIAPSYSSEYLSDLRSQDDESGLTIFTRLGWGFSALTYLMAPTATDLIRVTGDSQSCCGLGSTRQTRILRRAIYLALGENLEGCGNVNLDI